LASDLSDGHGSTRLFHTSKAIHFLWKPPHPLSGQLLSSWRPEKEHCTELQHTLQINIELKERLRGRDDANFQNMERHFMKSIKDIRYGGNARYCTLQKSVLDS
jgi:hypothetical protein